MIYDGYQIHKGLFSGANANGISRPIFAQGFPTAQFTLQAYYSISYKTKTGTYTVGETVTGGTSGATGVILSDFGTTLLLGTVTGVFVTNETITGGTSGAHATSVNLQIPNFQVAVIKSNQETLPDPTLPSGPDNKYSYVSYVDEATGVDYAVGNFFNPSAIGGVDRTFNIESTGSRWYWIQILGYVSGMANRIDAELTSPA